MQTTQHYVEMSQDLVDKKFKKWKDTWFGNKIEIKKVKDNIPDFLKNSTLLFEKNYQKYSKHQSFT